VRTAREDGDGRYWAQYEGPGRDAMGEQHLFPVSLYSGGAGTGIFLLNLHLATGKKRYLEAARGVGLRLINIAKRAPKGGLCWEGSYERKGRAVPDGTRVGLYNGNAGIGLFLIHLYEATTEKRFLDAAKGAFERILVEAQPDGEGVQWLYGSRDIIAGAAGIGLALLESGRVTKDPRYGETAGKAARWLLGESETSADGLRWKGYKPYDAGFSHGASGFAFFLETVGERDGARSAAGWVESVAVPSGESAILWRYYPGEPPEGKRQWTFNGWCHGAPGVVRLFLLLHAHTGEQRYLDLAVRGGGGVRDSLAMDQGEPKFYNPTYCCGAAGCLETFCDLYQATREKRWVKDARTLADSMLGSMRKVDGVRLHTAYDESDESERKHPFVPTGFMHGNAGIGQALLRLALLTRGEESKLVLLADHPFALPTGEKK